MAYDSVPPLHSPCLSMGLALPRLASSGGAFMRLYVRAISVQQGVM